MVPWNIVLALLVSFIGCVITGLCIYSDFIDFGGDDVELS